MKTNFFKSFFQEYLNGNVKSSQNRLIAFILTIVCSFIAIWCVMHKQSIPDATMVEFLSFIAVLLGLSWSAKNTDIKNPLANPNLPPPTCNPLTPPTNG